jgi:hypothetical protein
LRQFVVMRVAYTCHNARFDEEPEEFPHEFLIDLAKFATKHPRKSSVSKTTMFSNWTAGFRLQLK